jgi:hypothetical protein
MTNIQHYYPLSIPNILAGKYDFTVLAEKYDFTVLAGKYDFAGKMILQF